MMNKPILLGGIPEIFRQGSPVVLNAFALRHAGTRGTVHDIANHHASVALDGIEVVAICPLNALSLDLTEATGRAHAAWWLASQVKWWVEEPNYTTATWRRWANQGGFDFRWGLGPSHTWPDDHVGFGSLHHSNETRLPDNSLWVGAESLRRICMHTRKGISK